MAKSIARFRGVCLTPGVSKNQRYYSRESIVDAVERAQARIDAGDEPITVLTHHGAGDDSTRIAGRVAKLSVDEDGVARYEAELADTDHARSLLNLIDTSDGAPFLRGVSIRGAWLGKVQRKMVDGTPVECGESLELHGLDLTKTPGVVGAGIDSVTRTGGSPSESAEGRTLIYESAEALVTFTEETVVEGGQHEELTEVRRPMGHVLDNGRCVSCGY